MATQYDFEYTEILLHVCYVDVGKSTWLRMYWFPLSMALRCAYGGVAYKVTIYTVYASWASLQGFHCELITFDLFGNLLSDLTHHSVE